MHCRVSVGNQKKKGHNMPWAAPRQDWKGRDWGGPFLWPLALSVPLDTADYVVPAPVQDGVTMQIREPTRPAKCAQALNMFQMVLHFLPRPRDVLTWSLHSPCFFMPSHAGQIRFCLEERRTLGRWGPSSGMPV